MVVNAVNLERKSYTLEPSKEVASLEGLGFGTLSAWDDRVGVWKIIKMRGWGV